MSIHTISLTVNGSRERLTVPSNTTLLQMLREGLALTGTKNGCAAGECGACTVLLNGEPVNACMVLAVEADGAEIVTVEGLAALTPTPRPLAAPLPLPRSAGAGEGLSPLQQAFIEAGAVQCGFCTPGMLLSAYALLQRNPQPNEEEIRQALVGNLCRCTGYNRIVQAIREAGSKGQDTGSTRQDARSTMQEAKEGPR